MLMLSVVKTETVGTYLISVVKHDGASLAPYSIQRVTRCPDGSEKVSLRYGRFSTIDGAMAVARELCRPQNSETSPFSQPP